MVKESLPIEGIDLLEVSSVGGDLYLTGWAKEEIQIKDLGSEDQYRVKKERLEIQFLEDGILHIPHNLPVKIKTVNGDAVLKEIGSEIKIGTVNGDLRIRDLGSVVIETIQGDLIAKRIQDDLKVKTVHGNAMIDDIKGQVGLDTVSGDLFVEKVAGGLEAKANGDGTLDFSPVPWQAYRIDVGGDLSFSLPEDCNADLTINSKGGDIRVMLGDLDITSRKKELNQRLGEGGTAILLSAGGSVFLSSDLFNLSSSFKYNLEGLSDITTDFAIETGDQIKENLVGLEFELRSSMADLEKNLEEIGLSEENLRNFGNQLAETSKIVAEKAELAAIKAQAKAEKEIAKARRKALKTQAKLKQFDLGEFLETQKEKKTVNEAERMMILGMLQEKKISLEEADQLLNALEGKK